MKEIDLKDLIYESLTDLGRKFNSTDPYKYLEGVSFTQLATDLEYELSQRGVDVEDADQHINTEFLG
jgi:hypothetical protein